MIDYANIADKFDLPDKSKEMFIECGRKIDLLMKETSQGEFELALCTTLIGSLMTISELAKRRNDLPKGLAKSYELLCHALMPHMMAIVDTIKRDSVPTSDNVVQFKRKDK